MSPDSKSNPTSAVDKLMLHAHLENSESLLQALSKVQTISGHSLHKGDPRELFVREFLAEHLPLDLAIGRGELIDSKEKVGGKRNQHDVVIYERSFPRIHLGGNINAFFCESVLATTEVKSDLMEKDLIQAVKAARVAKSLQPTGSLSGLRHIRNYVIAYKGPTNIKTVFRWLANAYKKVGLEDPSIPPGGGQHSVISPALDGIYVFGVGACIFENNVGFLREQRAINHPKAVWSLMTSKNGALAMFFAALVSLFQGRNPAFFHFPGGDPRFIQPLAYLTSFTPSSLQFGRIDAGGSITLEDDKVTS